MYVQVQLSEAPTHEPGKTIDPAIAKLHCLLLSSDDEYRNQLQIISKLYEHEQFTGRGNTNEKAHTNCIHSYSRLQLHRPTVSVTNFDLVRRPRVERRCISMWGTLKNTIQLQLIRPTVTIFIITIDLMRRLK